MRTGRRKTGSRLMDCRLIRAMDGDPWYRLHCRVEENRSEVAHNNEEDVISSGENGRDSQGYPVKRVDMAQWEDKLWSSVTSQYW